MDVYLMDYHQHSNHSYNNDRSMQYICEQAIQKGYKEICFTEHYSVNPFTMTYGHLHFDQYFAEIEFCRGTYSKELTIKTGIEICEPHVMAEKYELVLNELDFDIVLGGVHNLHNEKISDTISKYGTAVYSLYFDEIYQMVSKADIDVIAHLDLIKHYAFTTTANYDLNGYEEILRAILRKAIKRNIGLEINVSSLSTSPADLAPIQKILMLYKEMGGEILTIGSGCGNSQLDVQRIMDGYELAKSCGFDYIFKYESRFPKAVAI